jgi:hypothetical protein
MHVPQFTAETSLYEAVRHYLCTAVPVNSASETRIVPQVTACGDCPRLTRNFLSSS